MKHCEGCKADCENRYSNSYSFRMGIPFNEFKTACPCNFCIVKVICQGICHKFYLYVTGGKTLSNKLISRFVEVDGWTHMSSWNEKGEQGTLCGRTLGSLGK
jgi:hypothetical protein